MYEAPWQVGGRSITGNARIVRWAIKRRSSSGKVQAMQMWKANNASHIYTATTAATEYFQSQTLWLIQLAWIKKHAVMIHLYIGHAATRVSPRQCHDSCCRIDRYRSEDNYRGRLIRRHVDRIAPS
jgi:hypothetical protein